MDSACGRYVRGENCMEYLVRKVEGNNHAKIFTVNGKTTLKMILKKQNAMVWT